MTVNKKEPLSKKERIKIPRVIMPEQEPKERVKNFKEVPFGLPIKLAQIEAQRCIECKKPVCIAGCPVEVDIPAFLMLIVDGDFIGAAKKIKETNQRKLKIPTLYRRFAGGFVPRRNSAKRSVF
jgi:glutamate synthase (NADPH/NADH) small chain